MAHALIELYIHIVFSTKNRLALIDPKIETQLYSYLSKVAQEQQSLILAINGMPDHLHISLKLHPSIALSDLLRNMKSYSSGWLKRKGFNDFSWQEGYGAYSCSVTHLDALAKYIGNQKEHHKVETFEEELRRIEALWNSGRPILD